ncbi:type 4a pilus biogenesis protein PilO [Evansella cellulosilytica]|uniref:Type IV pilus assembly protein PilO n=1 Tax=Evansella cellulosilytica (strain ATCC 21833 / DSM 2522 / FERM P-1141 / JCM 9156 / N-4) TaxID=649639 RepID=E6TZN3_EVAC2|nr:type 4a pilus biogenesis protein PilO [Evansella cellulosilytica]ADU31339.1 hypothetical protein Bcell_3096 [Evansella cellulosilytica DSM 2522]
MKLETSRIQKLIIAFVIVVVLSVVAAYFLMISPLQKEVESARNELHFEEQLLETLQQNNDVEPDLGVEEIMAYIQKVPVMPLIENWMVDLERAETASNTSISNYSFSQGETSFSIQEEAVESDEASDATEEEQVNTSHEQTVHYINASLTVTANRFADMYTFIEKVEDLNRITKVSALSFGEPSGEEEGQILSFQMTITTYYLPELKEELEHYELTEFFIIPSGKEQPF